MGDRNYRRVQVFTLEGKYLNQVFVNPKGIPPAEGKTPNHLRPARLAFHRTPSSGSCTSATTTTATSTSWTGKRWRSSDCSASGREARRLSRPARAATDRKETSGPPKPNRVRRGRAFSDSCSKACPEHLRHVRRSDFNIYIETVSSGPRSSSTRRCRLR